MKIIKYIVSYIRFYCLRIMYRERIKNTGNKFFIDIFAQVILYKNSNLNFKNNLYVGNYSSIECKGGNIEMGENIFLNKFCRIVSYKNIRIGNDCIFGPNVSIYDHNHNYTNKEKAIRNQGFKIDEVKIGNNVWVGANVVITAGAKIGNNVVIGANSVAKGTLDSDAVYCGNPAIFVKNI